MSTIEDELLVTNAAGLNGRDSFGAVVTSSESAAFGISIIDRYLLEQQELSAVERFSHFHDDPALLAPRSTPPDAPAARPLQSRYYSALLPAMPPREGEQYAFEVDLDSCSGCKACVTACHSLNGLDPGEIWRDVGLLHGGTSELPVMQHVTAACHHCIDPACLNACPVMAYEKNPLTGIVKHLDDQCIGCQYCIFACPYDVPKYNKKKGIIRKCDMCSSRLAVGEAPACVQACPHQAIRITIAVRQDVIDSCQTNQFLPGAPDPNYTLPTTNYKSSRPFPRNMLPADYYTVRPEHAHWPLILMLVLTQLAVGAFAVEWLLTAVARDPLALATLPVQSLSMLGFGLLALGVSVLHLGRPQYAFRAVLGLRTSWLSREIVTFGLFAFLAAAYAAANWFAAEHVSLAEAVTGPLGAAVVASGVLGVFCSVMVYQCTRRDLWNGFGTTARFLFTSIGLGLATALVTSLAADGFATDASAKVMAGYGRTLCEGLIAAMLIKLAIEASLLRYLLQPQNTPMKRSAQLMIGPLSAVTKARFICGFAGGVVLPWMLLSIGDQAAAGEGRNWFLALAAISLFGLTWVGEVCERYLFFTAVVPPKMPGGPRS
jgi:Fe-S-cluster-containing dehydrogenase component/DMSO reductase anchor subunit